MFEATTPPSIVVGIDGSRGAIDAALWAADEALERGIALRLLYAIAPLVEPTHPDMAARQLAIAESAVRYATVAIEASEKPLRIEVEIVQDHPVVALTRASAAAAMVCVGAIGLRHFSPGRTGSTAAALATSAHCPVAVIRGHGDRCERDEHWIVVDPHGPSDNDAVMGIAMQEARLRDLPLRTVNYRHRAADDHSTAAASEISDLQSRSNSDRRLEQWRRRYPDVKVDEAVSRGSLLEFVAANGPKVRMVVLGVGNHDTVKEFLAPVGNAVLHSADCSLLIVDHHNL